MPQVAGTVAPYGLNPQRSYPLVYFPMAVNLGAGTADYTVGDGEYLRLLEVHGELSVTVTPGSNIGAVLEITPPAANSVTYFTPKFTPPQAGIDLLFGSYISTAFTDSAVFAEAPIPAVFLAPGTRVRFETNTLGTPVTSIRAYLSGDLYAWDGSGDDAARAAAAPRPLPL